MPNKRAEGEEAYVRGMMIESRNNKNTEDEKKDLDRVEENTFFADVIKRRIMRTSLT